MKKMMLFLIVLSSTAAFADQCELMSSTMAKRASLLLQNGTEIATVCEPCGERVSSAKISVIRSVKVVNGIDANLHQLLVNGKSEDLAYTFIKVAPNRFVNIAKVIGCKANGISETISQ